MTKLNGVWFRSRGPEEAPTSRRSIPCVVPEPCSLTFPRDLLIRRHEAQPHKRALEEEVGDIFSPSRPVSETEGSVALLQVRQTGDAL